MILVELEIKMNQLLMLNLNQLTLEHLNINHVDEINVHVKLGDHDDCAVTVFALMTMNVTIVTDDVYDVDE